jgi:hypothetical protein
MPRPNSCALLHPDASRAGFAADPLVGTRGRIEALKSPQADAAKAEAYFERACRRAATER